MSIETVRNKCIEGNPGGDCSKLDASILKAMKRFEKIVRTNHRDHLPVSWWRMVHKKDETISQARNEHFEKNKLEFVHMHLTMLIDLYDYKK